MARFGLRRRPAWSGPEASFVTTAKEAFRVLRSNLLVSIAELENPIVVVTSAFAKEGKTSTCVRLAQSLASAGSRVVLVDLDLREPDSHRLLGANNDVGLSDVLLDHRSLDECLQYVELGVQFVEVGATDSARRPGMHFLGTGPRVSSPTELLSTPQMGKLLDRLAVEADIVLLDAPPVLPVADTLVIGRLAAGAVLVVEAGRTPVPAVKRAKDALTRNQTRLLGVVLNKFKSTRTSYDYGRYGYGNGSG